MTYLRALTAELKQLVEPQQEGVWKSIKGAASKVGDVADTAVSAIPVVGTAYDATRGALSGAAALGHGAAALGKWATGNRKGAKASLKQAASSGADAAGRAVGVGAGMLAPGVGGAAASLATKAFAKPLIKTAVKSAFKAGAKDLAKKGVYAAHKALNKPPVATAGESIEFDSARSLVEFRTMAGLPITKAHQTQLEAEDAAQ
jgi:hypothetical protein